MRKSKWKTFFGLILAAALLAINALPQTQALRRMPDVVHLHPGESAQVDFLLPLDTDIRGEAALVAGTMGETLADYGITSSYGIGVSEVEFRCLGLPLKTVTVQVEPQRILIPGGSPVGVTLQTAGVYVVRPVDVVDAEGNSKAPAENAGIQSGDLLLSINGETLSSIDDLTRLQEKNGQNSAEIKYKRENRTYTAEVLPAQDEGGAWRIGLWVRDSTAGVGTLTYADPENQSFGALGHAITDADTFANLPLGTGDIFTATIMEVVKGQKGTPGELRGLFTTERGHLGTLSQNTDLGIYGTLEQPYENSLYPEGLPAASPSQVHTGPASILCTIDSTGVQEFACTIIKVNSQSAPSQRSLVLEITDPDLLAVTGGIVQGMSGSPILQDGAIVGAVTHVYVSDPTRGYGVYIEWMLEQEAA